MTIGDWLASREPRPPAELSQRLIEAIGDHATRPAEEAPRAFLAVAQAMTEEMLANGSTTRDAALDLLTIDALVTYAYEAAAELPDAGRDLAIEGMSKLSRASLSTGAAAR